MARITIQRLWGNQEVDAEVFGPWAVHASVNQDADWAITHVESGLVLGDIIGWAEFDRDAAVLVARALAERCPPIPRSTWGQVQKPGSDSLDWACVVESIAAEILSEVQP